MHIGSVPRVDRLVIGLVNNMPAPACDAAEAQFRALLAEAANSLGGTGLPITLRCFSPRPAPGSGSVCLDELWRSRLDGVIVTGVQPEAEAMADEPAWPMLQRLVDWAAENTHAAIWSCLAAHAAVHALDGLTRHRLPVKLSGVYRCERAAETGLMAGAPASWPVPHSRQNDIGVAALKAAGYRILSRGPGAAAGMDGADSFEKYVGRSWFLMLQGHPEYHADSLLREYRRDLRAFWAGTASVLPEVPAGLFDTGTTACLQALQTRSLPETLSLLDAVMRTATIPRWRAPAVALFARWLARLAADQGHGLATWRRVAS